MTVSGSVLATPDLFFFWQPTKFSEVTPDSLLLITLLNPKPGMIYFQNIFLKLISCVFSSAVNN